MGYMYALYFGIFGPWWGALVTFMLVVLVNIVYLPAIIFISVTLLNYNMTIFNYRIDTKRIISFPKVAFKVSLGIMVIFSSIIVEQIMSNFVVKIATYLNK